MEQEEVDDVEGGWSRRRTQTSDVMLGRDISLRAPRPLPQGPVSHPGSFFDDPRARTGPPEAQRFETPAVVIFL